MVSFKAAKNGRRTFSLRNSLLLSAVVLILVGFSLVALRGNNSDVFYYDSSSLLLLNFTSAEESTSSSSSSSQQQQTSASSSNSDWPGVPAQQLGHGLVQKGTNFVSSTTSNIKSLFLQHLEDFVRVYQHRPDRINMCGIRINHALALYLTVRTLRPTAILESGVNAGQSTYFMRAAAAASKDTKIYAMDPEEQPICGQPTRWMDPTNKTEYLTGVNFKDINDVDWAVEKDIDPATTLVFLDDHLRVFQRLRVLRERGFRHVLLEDNYKVNEGATRADKGGWTPKQMLHRVDADSEYLWRDMLLSYAEFPPLVFPILPEHQQMVHAKKTAGGFLHPNDPKEDIVEPLLRIEKNAKDLELYKSICQRLGMDPHVVDFDSYMQIMNYNFIAYFELAPK